MKLRKGLFSFLSSAEHVLLGWPLLERMLIHALGAYYSSKFRREWIYSETPPHFFDQNIGCFHFGFGGEATGAYPFFRGFYVAEIIRDGDYLLDVGCGDGFFTKRFYSPRCSCVDGVDVDADAIRVARRRNDSPNVRYHLLNALTQPFPEAAYDVVVFDGAIGHFSAEDGRIVLAKIAAVLKPGGVFVGSESLGLEGGDHLQFFSSIDDLYDMFKPYFIHVEIRQQQYRIGRKGEILRQEAYWRCANDPQRLRNCHWIGGETAR